MAEPTQIVDAALRLLQPALSKMPAVLVTAGRTEEGIDPVRFLSNHSSGKMGVAVATAAREAGHPVTLVHGRLAVPPPLGVERIEVSTAAEMLQACRRLSGRHPILIMAAAVADYRSEKISPRKIESGRDRLSLKLVPTPDLLAALAPTRVGKRTVGFALETTGSRERARQKMVRKHCDLMVLNNPMRPGSEFGGETNEVVLLYPDGRAEALPVLPKIDVAREIIRRTMEIAPSRVKRKGRA